MHERSILVHPGVLLDPFDLKPEDIKLCWIAWALAGENRYVNQAPCRYSVGQHSVECVETLWGLWGCPSLETLDLDRLRILRAMLLHDSGEALFLDVPRPYKRFLFFRFPDGTERSYKEVEEEACEKICRKYDAAWPFPPIIKQIDNAMLERERVAFWPERYGERYEEQPPLNVTGPTTAESDFLFWAHKLGMEERQ